MLKFTIYGNPVAQGKPRFARIKTKSGKEIKWQAIEQKTSMMRGAVEMELYFYLSRPKSLPKKAIWHIKKPDLDNLIKAVKDELKGICYRDDSQIISLVAQKVYGKPPRVEVQMNEV